MLLAKLAFKPTPDKSVLPGNTDEKYLEPVGAAQIPVKTDAALAEVTWRVYDYTAVAKPLTPLSTKQHAN